MSLYVVYNPQVKFFVSVSERTVFASEVLEQRGKHVGQVSALF